MMMQSKELLNLKPVIIRYEERALPFCALIESTFTIILLRLQ